MADLRRNVTENAVAGAIIGVIGAANRFLTYGVPVIYDLTVGKLGRWGEGVFAIAMGFVMDFLADRVAVLERLRVPSRFFIYGVYRLVTEAMDMVGGKGFAYIAPDGSIRTDPSDTISAVYMQKGDTVVRVQPGSRTAVLGIRRYIAAGSKRVYYFETPYELPAVTA
jgi:hypothetical protein